jgi:hypothetical protein
MNNTLHRAASLEIWSRSTHKPQRDFQYDHSAVSHVSDMHLNSTAHFCSSLETLFRTLHKYALSPGARQLPAATRRDDTARHCPPMLRRVIPLQCEIWSRNLSGLRSLAVDVACAPTLAAALPAPRYADNPVITLTCEVCRRYLSGLRHPVSLIPFGS